MESHKVKLVKSENTSEEYFILLDKEVGKGGFGTVYEAYNCANKSQRLVAKIMKIQNESRRKTIQSELKVLSELPSHENIVRIIPSKIYSESNYYLFMEYCEEGTLFDLMVKKKNQHFSEEEIYSMFYQCMNGYKVLFDRKILHQDIKPQNVLIKNGAYKLADFGLSIFYEGYSYTMSREGTLRYIAPQKLTVKDYVGNPKSDVYSFGVMFFELITGCHPYIRPGENSSVKEFLRQLKEAKLRLPNSLTNKLSLQFNQFFDSVILKMLKKTEKNRITFEQIWKEVETCDIFASARTKQRQLTKKHIISEYDFVVSEVTSVLSIPLNQQTHKIELQREREEKDKQQFDQMIQDGKTVADYFVKRRIIIYRLDRLIRKLVVQELKSGKKIEIFDRSILYLMLLTKLLLNQLVNEIKNPSHFNVQFFTAFKKTHPLSHSIINLLRKDHEYVEDSLCDLLSEQTELSRKQTKAILQVFKQNNKNSLITSLDKSLLTLVTPLVQIVDTSNKSHLITLVNIFSTIDILGDLQKSTENAEAIEASQKNILMSSTQELVNTIERRCRQSNLVCGFDLTGVAEEDEQVVFE